MTDMTCYQPTESEITFLSEASGLEISMQLPEQAQEGGALRIGGEDDIVLPDTKTLIAALTCTFFEEGPEGFLAFAEGNMKTIRDYAAFDEDVAKTLIICYKMGIAQENGGCANNLGALYYGGEFVEQDYQKAAELYEQAMEWGCVQSAVNLGYIYEYGRTGEPDYARAYLYYSFAAALEEHSEALYKMGDLFSRGKPFGKDIKKAYQLWERSLIAAQDIEEEAQPAIRLAKVLIDTGNGSSGIEYDPLRALHLFQVAEVGLRLSIEKGYTYYSKRLQEAIKGQDQARADLDMRLID